MDGCMESSCRPAVVEVSDGDDADESMDNKGDDEERDGRNLFVCLLQHQLTNTHLKAYRR